MVLRMALGAAALVALSTQAQAMCKDDLDALKPRIEHLKTADPQRYSLAERWWGRALEAQPGSEVECLNFVARARKALTDPVPEIADCTGPNALLPNCQGPVRTGDMGVGPAGPVEAIGGGGGAVAAGPTTQGGSPQLAPPGSIQGQSNSPR